MPLLLDLLLERRSKIKQWIFLPISHYCNLEYFVEILHWTGSLSLSPVGICDALIYMLKKDFCSTWTAASKIAAPLQYKRYIAQRGCSAVNLMTSATFFNEMRKIIRPMHCPLVPSLRAVNALVKDVAAHTSLVSSFYLTQKMTLKTEPGEPQCQISTGLNKILDW